MAFRELVGLVMMMVLLKPISGRDSVLVLRSNATYQCNGFLGGCGIREELESELDLLMIDSTVIRILGVDKTVGKIYSTLTKDKPAVKQKDCGPTYSKCLPPPNPDNHNKNCKGNSPYCR
ncbi:hypothetical protein [Gossypium barbadense]|uniref:Uncharacterized protein n=1 Tax=Gossypium barbadense TaxID=3634 RepID=A0A5J5N6Y0_GOSBA|nr:hypothetical protein ES319_1Z109100v1 [Gossypium barbadense]KAB1671529.1 hypothetical protein [Gossypium barbadense]